MREITKIPLALLPIIILLSTSECQTFHAIIDKSKAEYMEPTSIEAFKKYNELKNENPALAIDNPAIKQAIESDLSDIYSYCTGIARYQEHGIRRTRALKNVVAAVGTIAGGIIAPVFAEGSAIAAWASVSGASSSVLSRMFDNATSSSLQGLSGERATVAQELLHVQSAIGQERDYVNMLHQGKRLFSFCQLHDYRSKETENSDSRSPYRK